MKNEAFYSIQHSRNSATELTTSATEFPIVHSTIWSLSANSATECTHSGPEKSHKEKAGKAHKIGHRRHQFGHRFFTPSNFNFKSNFNISPPWLQIDDDATLTINHQSPLPFPCIQLHKVASRVYTKPSSTTERLPLPWRSPCIQSPLVF